MSAARTDGQGYFVLPEASDPERLVRTHFHVREFLCRCGCDYNKVSETLIARLEQLRIALGVPVIIQSGIRCPAHNAHTGGAPGSQHLPDAEGISHAADIRSTPAWSPAGLYMEWRRITLTGGSGLYLTWLHVDDRPGRMEWVEGVPSGPMAVQKFIAQAAIRRLA